MAGVGQHHDRDIYGRARLHRREHRTSGYHGDARCQYHCRMGSDRIYAGYCEHPSRSRLAVRPVRIQTDLFPFFIGIYFRFVHVRKLHLDRRTYFLACNRRPWMRSNHACRNGDCQQCFSSGAAGNGTRFLGHRFGSIRLVRSFHRRLSGRQSELELYILCKCTGRGSRSLCNSHPAKRI